MSEVTMRNLMMCTALAAVLGAGPVWAQSNAEPPQPPQIPALPDPGQGPAGGGQGSQAAPEGTFEAPGGQQMMVSDLIGATVRNDQGEAVGEVEDVMLSQSGQVEGLVLSVGDFLGIGGKNVGIRMERLQFGSVSGPDPEVVVKMSRDDLNNAPEYGAPAAPNPPSPGNRDDSLTRASAPSMARPR